MIKKLLCTGRYKNTANTANSVFVKSYRLKHQASVSGVDDLNVNEIASHNIPLNALKMIKQKFFSLIQ